MTDATLDTALTRTTQVAADRSIAVVWTAPLSYALLMSQEAFIRGMRHRVVKPTCCWGQLRTVQVHLQTAEEAIVEAQVGVDVKTLGATVACAIPARHCSCRPASPSRWCRNG